MGMAAGQARLLSITSRMSDNELRAQLINNSKLRLATESSQASEAYTTALNEAQMMFTNYGPDNTSSYQQLTYNSLTKYNPYNNQYALANSSGQVLVSETDAANYVNAQGSLDRFLASYGLTQGTTYFDELSKYTDASGVVDGIGYTPQELESLYMGTNGNPGYTALLESSAYYNYTKYSDALAEEYETLVDTIWPDVEGALITGKNEDGSAYSGTVSKVLIDGQSLADFKTNKLDPLEGKEYLNTGDVESSFDKFYQYIQSCGSLLRGDTSNTLYQNVMQILDSGKASAGHTIGNGSDVHGGPTTEYGFSLEMDGESTCYAAVDDFYLKFTKQTDGSWKIDTTNVYYYNDDTEPNGYVAGNPTDGAQVTSKNLSDSTVSMTIQANGTDQVVLSGIKTSVFTSAITDMINAGKTTSEDCTWTSAQGGTITLGASAGEEVLLSSITQAYTMWTSGLEYHIDPTAFPGTGDVTQFVNTARDFANFLFTDASKISDSELLQLVTYEDLYELMKNKGLNITDAFDQVLDLFTLENMMDLYGEPKIAWIDSTDPNGTGDADKKAQWYTNLFERMGNGEKNNFKVLGNGLAASAEWIKYALESGLVTMEQVTESNEWTSVMYTSVSDITEQSNDLAVTIAEAEYQKAMNKIEAKDKQYDLELKNIDTEHNSLQTEYDSIKSAIDKNVERTFKLYS